jgi:hypothetical protein
MKMQIPEGSIGTTVMVTLSRRNLLALLHKLDMEGSARTLIKNEGAGKHLIVQAEDDEEHYNRPEGPAGPMHPETEGFISKSEEKRHAASKRRGAGW